MRYRYKMVGRCDGSLSQTEYSGVVSADTPGGAALAALAAEFGDEGYSDPVEALTVTGWIDRESLLEQLELLRRLEQDEDDLDGGCEFYNDDLTFLVEVEEAPPAG